MMVFIVWWKIDLFLPKFAKHSKQANMQFPVDNDLKHIYYFTGIIVKLYQTALDL